MAWEKHTCLACGGTGGPECNDIGTVKTKGFPVKCRACGGTGRGKNGGMHSACRGTGYANGYRLNY